MWPPVRAPFRALNLRIPTLVCRTALLAVALYGAPRTEAAAASEVAYGQLASNAFLAPWEDRDALRHERPANDEPELEVEPESFLENTTRSYRTVEALPTSYASRLPNKFQDCALIGSSSILKGASRGAEIDAHKTIIRINRLPTINDMQDFGTRTDVVYLNKANSRAGNITYFGG